MPCELAIRPSAIANHRLTLPAVITSLSCDGAGIISNISRSSELRRGQPSNLEFELEGRQLSLRSQLAWHARLKSGQTLLGLRLLLALCPRELRCTYSEWIIALLRDQQVHTPNPEASLNRNGELLVIR